MNEQHLDALPPVNLNQQPAGQAPEQGGEAPAPVKGEQPGSPSPAAPLVADPAPATDAPPAADPVTAASVAPILADDVDLIEKEWVERAKQIVEQTKHDPYQQNEAMTKMKTDYLKKRYNREIKKSEA